MSGPQARADRLAQAVLLGATLLVSATLLWPGPVGEGAVTGSGPLADAARSLARVSYDDGYYYLEIARHVARGEGSSFDGLEPTNGYHPLWMLALVPISAATEDPAARLALAGALQVLLTGLGALAAYRAARELVGPEAACLAGLAWLQYAFTYRATLSGLEFALQALLLFAVAGLHVRAWRAGGLKAGEASWLGLLLGALFLARLETLALGLLVCAAWAWRLRAEPGRNATLARVCAPLALAFAGYALLGTWLFGRAWPVSAHVKREWSQVLLLADPVLARHGRLLAELEDAFWPVFHQKRSLWSYLALGLGGPLFVLARRRTRALLHGLGPLVLFSWLQYLAAVWVYHGGYAFQPWYYLAPAWLACLLGAQALEALGRRSTRAGRVGLLLAATGLLAFSVHTAARARSERIEAGEPLHVAARWVREHVPAGERAGAWNAGGTAFFSGRSVTGLDGLVNSWPYALGGRLALCEYWHLHDVRYLVDAFRSSDRFGFLRQPLPCLTGLEPVWVGPRFPKDPDWRIEAYRLPP